MKRDEFCITTENYLLLQEKYRKLKEEIENFLRKKSGYKNLREILKEVSS
jgi:hypothetical protein